MDEFHQTARVVSTTCARNRYETDRRTAADAAIRQALTQQAATLPGGLTISVMSLGVRVHCHTSSQGSITPYCISDATISLAASGRDRHGQAIDIEVTKDSDARVDGPFLCIDAMPAVTSSVDRVLAAALADLQRSLANTSGTGR